MDIHIHVEKKHFLSFLVLIGLVLSAGVTYAIVSHNSDQIILPDGTSLSEAVPNGEEICTDLNGKCVAASEVDPTVLTSVKDGVSWAELTGIPSGFSDNNDNVGISSCTYAGCTSAPTWNSITGPQIHSGRLVMVNVGCGNNYDSSCDANQPANGWPDRADYAETAGAATSATSAANADKLDNLDSASFWHWSGETGSGNVMGAFNIGWGRSTFWDKCIHGTITVNYMNGDGWNCQGQTTENDYSFCGMAASESCRWRGFNMGFPLIQHTVNTCDFSFAEICV